MSAEVTVANQSLDDLLAPLSTPQREYIKAIIGGMTRKQAFDFVKFALKANIQPEEIALVKGIEKQIVANLDYYVKERKKAEDAETREKALFILKRAIDKAVVDWDILETARRREALRAIEIYDRLSGSESSGGGKGSYDEIIMRRHIERTGGA